MVHGQINVKPRYQISGLVIFNTLKFLNIFFLFFQIRLVLFSMEWSTEGVVEGEEHLYLTFKKEIQNTLSTEFIEKIELHDNYLVILTKQSFTRTNNIPKKHCHHAVNSTIWMYIIKSKG